MKEISLILRNNLSLTTEEFKILDRHACPGKIWTLIQKPTPVSPFVCRNRTLEYIFDPEALIIFYIVSTNVLATWETNITRNFGPDDELQIKDSLFIKPYYH